MTEQRRTDLKELQKLDIRIKKARERILEFDPLLEEVEEPALILENDLGTTRTRLKEMKLEERRLELSVEEKRTRRLRLDERLGSVRNLREEAAVSAELEMVKRVIQNDEQEALTLMDQLRKMEERVAELETAFAEASEVVGPKKDGLLAERTAAQKALDALRLQREVSVGEIEPSELKVYDAIRSGGRSIAVSALTEDGACSHCYGVIPLQLQNEIRHGAALYRCEGCGVILTPPEPQAEAGAAGVSAPEQEPDPGADEPEAEAAEEGEPDADEDQEEE